MSMFRKPKKIQRRVFSSTLDEDENNENKLENDDADDLIDLIPPPVPQISDVYSKKKKDEKPKIGKKELYSTAAKSSLLSFADEEDDGEIFQVRKSSHSKKVMRMMDKERRRKKKVERHAYSIIASPCVTTESHIGNVYNTDNTDMSYHEIRYSHNVGSTTSTTSYSSEHRKHNKNDKIQTEIRTDDFVLVVKKSEPDIVLNGRAALCAGRNDISDEENDSNEDIDRNHRFSKPDHLKQMLESGSIPDAAMIHAARKRRQKARELGDYMPLEESKVETKPGSRLTNDDLEENNSDDEERMDMTVSTIVSEREERREQFYAIEKNYSEEDFECETNEWENQQIRKGVTGSQLVSAQSDSMLSRFMIKSSTLQNNEHLEENSASRSTSILLEQAYAKCSLEKPQKILNSSKTKEEKAKVKFLRSAQEIQEALSNRLDKVKVLNDSHQQEIKRIAMEMKALEVARNECKQKAPTVAAKYKFYQEIKCYITDLVDFLNEKTPLINDLEKRMLHFFAKHHSFLIERRRQDVRDQAKEMAEAIKSTTTTTRMAVEMEEQLRRAAEREGRRTRRRFERERNGLLYSHLDGMSSDDETSDRYQEQFQNNLEKLDKEAIDLLEDVNDEFCKIDLILNKFALWRSTDINSYKEAFVYSCLPKILSPLIRLEILSWSPLLLDYKEMEKFNWFGSCMLYGWMESENEKTLKNDPDVNLVPIVIEKIIIPKITEIVTYCWDPLSTTKTLRIIGFINRLGREYPLKESEKNVQNLFNAILDKMKLALDSDVFIPIFPKQVQENKTSFFQRQFSSGLKLFRNFLSWQGILADKPLREMAINSLLNRYLLLALRVCSINDAIAKAYMIVQTLPTVWLHPESEAQKSLQPLILYIKQSIETCDETNSLHILSIDKAKQILLRLHSL